MSKEMAIKIESLCKQKGIPMYQLESEAGLSHSYVRSMYMQNSTPSAKRLDAIAKVLNVSKEYLLGDTEEEREKGSVGVRVLLLGRVAAGIPIEAAENVIGEEEISKKLAATGEFFALLIKGDSMSPYIMNGDKVIVKQQSDAETGDIIIALVNGNDGVCKELKKIDSGIMLISKNPNYDPMIFTHADIDSQPVKILGKVVEIRRPL